MVPQQHEAWVEIAAFTRAMGAAAERGDWDEVAALEPQRRACLEMFFAESIPPEDAEDVAREIRNLLAQDRAIIEQGNRAKAAIADELGGIAQGRHAVAAYGQNP